MLTTATTWGITGPQFLWGYGVLSLAAALWIAQHWQRMLGPQADERDGEMPDLGLYELATLGEGPQLTITSAATQLHRDGVIKASLVEQGALEVAGELDADADPVERAVFETVRSEQPITAQSMRTKVAESDPLQAMTAELERDGLLVAPASVMWLARRVLLIGGLLALLGIVRAVAGALGGQPVGWIILATILMLVATVWLVGNVPSATRRGRAKLARWRDAHDDLRRNPIGGQCALAAALFGGAALWLAAPDIASALGVEREGASSAGGAGGGGCGSGCGGCGGCGGG